MSHVGQKDWAVARPPPLHLGNMKASVLLLDLPLLLPGLRMPSRSLRMTLAPYQCCWSWRPLSRLVTKPVDWVEGISEHLPPRSPTRVFMSAPWLGCSPHFQPCSIPTVSGDPMSYPLFIHLVPPACGAPHTSC